MKKMSYKKIKGKMEIAYKKNEIAYKMKKKVYKKKKKVGRKMYVCVKCGTEESIPEQEWAVSFTGVYCPRCKRRKMKEMLDEK